MRWMQDQRGMKLVLVDDDPEFAAVVEQYLTNKGHDVVTAPDGRAMRAALEVGDVDIVLLDLALPEEDGVALTQYLRSHGDVGIIILSGAGEFADRILALELGADDYLAKPFNLRELLARLNSLYRRGAAATNVEDYRFAELHGWRLDLQHRRLISPANEEVPLTTMEFGLLRAFVQQPNKELTREQLIEATKGRPIAGYERNVDVHIFRLRNKLEKNPGEPEILRTVHGVGYTMCTDVKMTR